ncbi:uncharacterized protein AB675_5170 [Cyphellophora attinorum]|uniref:F-box domain-containing protein n=1 Tax=Cyphellophora attinorum TaxID=1664694 RepID=A0A0N1HNX7_9EURO|nr:uncharacterized protein AB675_5170 [Phialophora attinorum]KPI39327.1 hypothetical protein AB675_5170 [Phialophora attinorum]
MPSFLGLPLELRETIFSDVLADLTACLVITDTKTSVSTTTQSSFSVCDFNKHIASLSRHHAEPITTSLLSVCRQIRNETIALAGRTLDFAVVISSSNAALEATTAHILQRPCIPPGWTIKLRSLSVTTYTLVTHHAPTFWQGFWTNVSSMCPFLTHGSVNRLSSNLQLLGGQSETASVMNYCSTSSGAATKVDDILTDGPVMGKYKAEAREQFYRVISEMPLKGERGWRVSMKLKFVVWITGVSVYGYDDFGCYVTVSENGDSAATRDSTADHDTLKGHVVVHRRGAEARTRETFEPGADAVQVAVGEVMSAGRVQSFVDMENMLIA